MKPFLVAALFSASATVAFTQTEGGPTSSSQATIQTDSRKTIDGFSGWLLITPEEDFDVELDTPSEHAQSFSDADQVRVGQKILILVLFANPRVDPDGVADVQCDVTALKPDQTVSISKPGGQCMKSRPPADKDIRYMAGTIIREPLINTRDGTRRCTA